MEKVRLQEGHLARYSTIMASQIEQKGLRKNYMKEKLTIRESFHLGKGWHLMVFAILAMLVTNAGVNDGLNIALPAIAEGSGLDYELCLSMGTVAGFVGVAMMLVIAKFRLEEGR